VFIDLYVYVCVHTYILTRKQKTYTHADIQVLPVVTGEKEGSGAAYIHTNLYSCIQTYRHTDIQTYISTYIHTNIYIQIYMYTYIQGPPSGYR